MDHPEEDSFGEIKEEVEREFRQRYLGDLDRLRRDFASELSGVLSRKVIEHMNLKKGHYREILLNGLKLALGGCGDDLEENVSAVFDDTYSTLLTDLVKLIPELVEGMFRWTGGEVVEELVGRMEELISMAAELEARKRVGVEVESEIIQKLIAELTKRDKGLRALRFLELQGPKTSVEVASYLRVADPTARDYLKRLEAQGYVERIEGRPIRYKFVRAPWSQG